MGGAELTLVATYRRTVQASLDRIWENVMDWEHLPALHRQSFLGVELLAMTPDTWRGRVTLPPTGAPRAIVIEVSLDRPNLRYWSRTVEGRGAGTEILTRLMPVSGRTTDVVVEFRIPGVSPKEAESLRSAYLRLYQQLWDQDEAMMVQRQRLLDQGFRDAEV